MLHRPAAGTNPPRFYRIRRAAQQVWRKISGRFAHRAAFPCSSGGHRFAGEVDSIPPVADKPELHEFWNTIPCRRFMAHESCPNCGADLRPRARSCPECGADETTGWSEEAVRQSLDLPDDTFDYDDFVKREFGDARRNATPGLKPVWRWVAAALVALFLYSLWRSWR